MPILSSGTHRNCAALPPASARHDVAAQTVHRTLQHHAANGRNAALQAHGNAHTAQLCAVGQAETALFPAPAQLRVVAQDVQKTAQTRHSLTDHSGKCRTECPHLEHDDAHQIQPDVQKACHQQEIQRALAVAQCTHQGAGHIIKQSEGGCLQKWCGCRYPQGR